MQLRERSAQMFRLGILRCLRQLSRQGDIRSTGVDPGRKMIGANSLSLSGPLKLLMPKRYSSEPAAETGLPQGNGS